MESNEMPRAPLARAITAALVAAPLVLLSKVSVGQGVDLRSVGSPGFEIWGADFLDRSGYSVSGAGDVNGDGLADLIVGEDDRAYTYGDVGNSYVVFGKSDGMRVDLRFLDGDGFRIDGSGPFSRTGFSVSGAGDVNGDGLADLIVGVPGGSPGGDFGAGQSYVLFGKTTNSTVNLANLGSGGFRIDGIDAGDRSGISVAGAGDVNGDGLADLIVGADRAAPGGQYSAGESYVVFGKANSTPVDLSNLGSGGFRIDGIDANDYSGRSVSGAGDVNGDGLSDLIVGVRGGDPGGELNAGESYVVFGKTTSSTVNLASLSSGGFRIDGIDAEDFSGFSVSSAGDVNGDGLSDLIVGASRGDPGGDSDAGESYVVFGKATNTQVNLANLGTGGFRIEGVDVYDLSGFSVSGAGDVNGDGLADLIVGAPFADPGGIEAAGENYVVFGKTNNTTVELGSLGTNGFRIDGIDIGGRAGYSVSGAGDVNGDGLADLIVGAIEARIGEFPSTGESYVVFSASVPPLNASYRARSGNGNPPQTAVGISGDGSNDSTPDARFWIDFADGDGLPSLASTETVRLSRDNGAFSGAAGDVSWQLQTTRRNWSTAEIKVRYLDSEVKVSNESSLQLVFSPNGSAPFTPLVSVVNRQNNTISAQISQAGFIYIGQRVLPPAIFANGFEP